VTPTHIVPEWYYLPFYAILRAIPNKLGGVIALGASIVILAFLPWLDTSKVRSARYRPLYRQFFWLFVLVSIGLGWLGSKPAEGGYVIAARVLTAYYFLHFLVILPLLGWFETTKPLPHSISQDVLKHKAKVATVALVVGVGALLATSSPSMAAEADTPPRNKWSFAGPFGKFDRGQLQRGFKVFKEVCQQCHGIQLLSFRNLAEPGGPGFTPAQVAVVAAEYKYKEQNEQGETVERNGRPGDHFPPPLTRFPTGTPPDLSVIIKARSYERGFPWFLADLITQYQEHGADYMVALLKGYENPPSGVELPPGAMYNKYFPGHATTMPPPLSDRRVEYTGGTEPTLGQLAKDVTAFLAWAAEPHLEARKRLGMQVIAFLIVLSGLLFFTKKKVWRAVGSHA
jgi:ubiquinol-cytochrome c reductase cytochrome b/c1 subunit